MKTINKILLIILLCSAIFGLDYYLRKNNFLFYSSGTKEKAFINTTWKMSPKEVQRVNNTNLIPAKITFFGLPDQDKYNEYPQVIRMERYKALEQKERITLWGFETGVEYAFFDDKFFEFTVFLEGYNPSKMHKKITSTLTKKYGIGMTEDNKSYLYSMRWETDSERVSYWMLEKGDKKNVKLFLAGVRIRYKPMLGEIRKISLKEHDKLF